MSAERPTQRAARSDAAWPDLPAARHVGPSADGPRSPPVGFGLGRAGGIGQNGVVRTASTRRRRHLGPLVGLLGVGGSIGGAALGCLALRDADATAGAGANPCVACHGNAARPGPVENQAAPPCDLDGNTDSSAPGVGAHEVHASASVTHGPVACSECHVVPAAVATPGHADSARLAEFTPGPLATLGDRRPRFDPATLTCSGTYCHQSAVPEWTRPRPWACGTCHALPPPPPHDPSEVCSDCHATISPGRVFLRPDLHVNGGVDVIGPCWDCHGTSSSFAPPPDTSGSLSVNSRGVGAHQWHLAGGSSSAPVACSSCHLVPAYNGAVGHIDGTSGAELVFSGVALVGGLEPLWDRDTGRCWNTWCHSSYPSSGQPRSRPSPPWTHDFAGAALPCTACHGMPPEAPHPLEPDCTLCHASVVAGTVGSMTIWDRSKHVNGIVDR
jgi:predicted CxxxxCH...CXXCH cytochrome family protein